MHSQTIFINFQKSYSLIEDSLQTLIVNKISYETGTN